MEQNANRFLDRFVTLDHFFVRKVLLFKYSYAFVILPGGFGTMDEFFEALTLIQTGKIRNFPLVVMGKDYYEKLAGMLEDMQRAGTIHAEDLRYVRYTDSIEQLTASLEAASREFGILRRPAPSRILGEKGVHAGS
jgi:uncharacterized protein (TIGR00730 family)